MSTRPELRLVGEPDPNLRERIDALAAELVADPILGRRSRRPARVGHGVGGGRLADARTRRRRADPGPGVGVPLWRRRPDAQVLALRGADTRRRRGRRVTWAATCARYGCDNEVGPSGRWCLWCDLDRLEYRICLEQEPVTEPPRWAYARDVA